MNIFLSSYNYHHSMSKPTPKKSKPVVEEKILEDFLKSGLMCNFLRNVVLKDPDNEDITQISQLFCRDCSSSSEKAKKPKRPKPKTDRPKRVLSAEHLQKLQAARQEKRKKREEAKSVQEGL